MTQDAALAHLETYLVQVRRQLQGLSDAEIREVLDELRSHVLDRVEGQLTPQAVETALAALGSPRDVARLNVTERVGAVMEADRPIFGVLSAVLRLANLSAAGFLLFLVSLLGYGLAGVFLFAALWKPFDPAGVGLWSSGPGNFTLGTNAHPGTPELLGWWIMPLGLAIGAGCGYLTWRFDRFCIRAMVRIAQRERRRP